MKIERIWFCENLEDPLSSGFGRSKAQAESYLEGLFGEDIGKTVGKRQAKFAVTIDVPYSVALMLLDDHEYDTAGKLVRKATI